MQVRGPVIDESLVHTDSRELSCPEDHTATGGMQAVYRLIDVIATCSLMGCLGGEGQALAFRPMRKGPVAELKAIFGQRLKAIRTSRGLTQEQLGREVGVDYKHLGAIERGVKAPSFDVAEKLAKVLKVEPYQLFLPSPEAESHIEDDLQAVMKELGRARRARIQSFFREVLRLMRRLDPS